LKVRSLVATGPRELAAITRDAIEISSANAAYVDATWRTQSFATVSETVDMTKIEAARGYVSAGMNDILIVNGYDVSGVGVWLGAPLPEARRPTIAERRTWSRIGSHLAAALRLRNATTPRPSAAVLTPKGKVEHAEGAAKVRDAREALQDAVMGMERARGPMRKRDAEGAVEQWKPMVHAHWSLLEQFERDGKRYIVAVENASWMEAPELLAPRERQVVAAAVAGRSNKLIAYELGLSHSTVRVLLARAAKKLRVKTRQELIAAYSARVRPPPPADE